jgi:hypothetical protein
MLDLERAVCADVGTVDVAAKDVRTVLAELRAWRAFGVTVKQEADRLVCGHVVCGCTKHKLLKALSLVPR